MKLLQAQRETGRRDKGTSKRGGSSGQQKQVGGIHPTGKYSLRGFSDERGITAGENEPNPRSRGDGQWRKPGGQSFSIHAASSTLSSAPKWNLIQLQTRTALKPCSK